MNDIRTKILNIIELLPTQSARELNEKYISSLESKDFSIDVGLFCNHYYILDGHRRLIKTALMHKKSVKCNIYTDKFNGVLVKDIVRGYRQEYKYDFEDIIS